MNSTSESKRVANRAYYAAHRQERLSYAREYREQHREGVRAYMRSYHERPEVKLRESERKRAEYKKAYYEANKEKRAEQSKVWRAANAQRIALDKKAAYVRDRKANLVRAAKYRARNVGVPFGITPSDLEWPEYCPVFGAKLNYETSSRSEWSPSLDRLIAANGYVKGNVVVISLRANRLKNSATPEEMRRLAKYIDTYLG